MLEDVQGTAYAEKVAFSFQVIQKNHQNKSLVYALQNDTCKCFLI